MKMLLLRFVRSIRTGDLFLYEKSWDQIHEQQNKELKMHGGTLNLSDESVFTEWAVAGPEITRVITEFEVGMLTRKNVVFQHHVQSPSVQQRFVAHTKALVIAFSRGR